MWMLILSDNPVREVRKVVMDIHFFKKDEEYYFFDNTTYTYNKIPKELGEEFSGYSDADITEQLLPLLKQQKAILPKVKGNSNKCKRLVILVDQICNLNCKYCYADGGSYGEKKPHLMNFDTYRHAVEAILEVFKDGIDNLTFFGGEPLINYELIMSICKWNKEYFPNKHLEPPRYSIVTNGTLIDSEIIRFFEQYKFSVTISLDGNKTANDTYRVFKNESGSVFDAVRRNIGEINKNRKNIDLAVEMTVTEQNINQFAANGGTYLKDIEALHSMSVDYLHIAPVLCDDSFEGNIQNNCQPQDVLAYFDAVAKYSLDSLQQPVALPVIKIIGMLDKIVHKYKSANFCTAGIEDFSININGDIYPCFVLNNQEQMKMGNVNSFDKQLFETKRAFFQNIRYDNAEECKNCWANGICSNCIANSYLIHKSLTKPLNTSCEMQMTILERIITEVTNHFDKDGVRIQIENA